MKALQLTGPHAVSLTELASPQPGPREVLVKVNLLGLCGTDLGFYDGSSNYLRDGHKSYPFIPGHEWIGTVVALGHDADQDLIGQRISGHNFRVCGHCRPCRRSQTRYCLDRSEIGVLGSHPGAASQFLAVPSNTLTRIPDGLSDAAGALLEPTAAAVHAVDRVDITSRDRVAILGAGTLGLASAQVSRALGAKTVVLDPHPAARELAAQLSLPVAATPTEADTESYDVVIEASGSELAVRTALSLVSAGGRIAQVGTPHHTIDNFDAASLVIRNATLHGVLSGIGYWDRLVDLVKSGTVNLDALVDRVYPLHEFQAAFAHLADGKRRRPKVLIQVNPGPTVASRPQETNHSLAGLTETHR